MLSEEVKEFICFDSDMAGSEESRTEDIIFKKREKKSKLQCFLSIHSIHFLQFVSVYDVSIYVYAF